MVAAYERRGLCRMFPWQRECLLTVLHSGRSLVYSAPTSAGKSLVAELLMLKRVLETHTKALMVLPFISLAREKLNALQEVACGIRVGGFMGQQRPPGGLASLDVAVCTIEKANGLVNRMLQEGTLAQLGTVVVDEVHLVGDPNRGYLLELMLAKLAYMARRGGSGVQVVAMSACLGNLEALARWLDAELYRCTERPVPLRQLFKVGEELWEGPPLRLVKGPGPPLPDDPEGLLQLCLETWLEGHAVLLFCPTRAWCEALALALARGARLLLARLHSGSLEATHLEAAVGLKGMLEGLQLEELGRQLAATPAGLDPALGRCLRCAVAFHHAGLTTDERDVVEEAFRRGVLRALVATSTLSSGVNLPARRVVIRTPVFHGAPLDVMAYRQMAGRAGRLGMDTHGESVLVCKASERGLAERLCGADPPPIGSSLAGRGAATPALKRALLEVVASGVASSPEELSLYWRCTLQHALSAGPPPLDACLSFLVQRQFVHLRGGGEGGPRYHPTQLGLAVLASSLSPDEALCVLADLEQARRCLVLENELHLVYLVTPVHLSSQLGAVDWGRYQALWEGLSPDRQRVAQQAGVTEASLAARGRGRESSHRRLLVALALEELLGERPLAQVAPRYGLPKGLLQSLQHGAATFAGMVCAFCEQLGWHGLRLLVSQLQSRLHFGVRPELVELLRLPCLDGPCARLLHDCGFTEPRCLAQATPASLELALSNAGPFRREDEETSKQTRRLWLPGRRPLSHLEAATIVIQEAREFVELCLGARVAWDGAGSPEASQAHSSRTTVLSTVPEKAQSAATMADAPSEECSSTQQVLCEVGDSESVLSKSPCALPVSSPACGDETLQCLEAFDCDSFFGSLLSVHSRTVSNSKEEGSLVWDSKEALDISKWSPAEKCLNSPLVESSSMHANINEDGLISILKAASIPSTSASTNGDGSKHASAIGDRSESRWVGKRTLVANGTPTDETDSFFVPKRGSIPRYSGNSLEDGSPGWGQSPILPVFLPEEEEYRLSDSFVLNSQTVRALDPPVVEVLARPAKRRSPGTARVTGNAAPVVPEVPGSPQEELFSSPCDHEVPCRLRLSPFSEDSSAGSASPPSPASVRRKRARAERSDEDLFASVCVDEPSGSPGGSPQDFAVCEEGDLSLLGGAWLERGLFSLALADDEQVVAVCWHGYRAYLLPLWQQPPGRHSFSQGREPHLDPRRIWPPLLCRTYTEKGDDPPSLSCPGARSAWQSTPKRRPLSSPSDLLRRALGGTSRVVAADVCALCRALGPLAGPDLCWEDLGLAHWLLDPGGGKCSLAQLVERWAPHLRPLLPQGQDSGSTAAAKSCVLALHLRQPIMAALQEAQLSTIFAELEMPALGVLCKMDCNGLGYAGEARVPEALHSALGQLQARCTSLAGRQLALHSPRDVSQAVRRRLAHLAEARGLLGTSSRPLTRAQLESLAALDPLPRLVLDWRKVHAVLNRSLVPAARSGVPCPELGMVRVHPRSEPHSATGRVSLREPNLQAVARDFEVALDPPVTLSPRRAFVPFQGALLLSADYSQLELHLLAHLSADEALVAVFSQGGDVFAQMAARWGHQTTRHRAKQICYGIVYGRGPRSLAEELGMEVAEADRMMADFRLAFPGLQRYANQLVSQARSLGHVRTVLGRRRPLPQLRSADSAVRARAERQALSTAVQGSAADLLKSALVAVDAALAHRFPHSRRPLSTPASPVLCLPGCGRPSSGAFLVLQLHDELLLEVCAQDLPTVAALVAERMRTALRLRVPLAVRLRAGPSWGQLEDYSPGSAA
ncbi:unnamed protein product [Ixodes pacificus]